uniref:Mechanosensitive ion channel MscS domain-containing protein n=1 Tax=Musa acuminata subsp. malaccensis TaxID=214687 RepID=A0A804JUX6_MUSAM|nr:PREDICTED: mechanosensitive ion channel protein 10-like isoform X3 [Musa acuminata subsp. malaccensis]
MDPQKGVSEKQVEVVLMIPGEEASAAAAASSGNAIRHLKVEPFEDFSKDESANKFKSPGRTGRLSPEITKSSLSPKKPPRPPRAETLVRGRSISKPKSRFVEQSVPPAPISADDRCPPIYERLPGSPNSKALGAPKTPSHAGDEEEEEEEDEAIYKKQQFADGGTPQRKWKVRVLIEWAILILAMGCLVTSLTVRRLHRVVIWGLEIWKWCLMVIVICCGRLVTYWLITLLVFVVERNFLLRKKVLYFVYGLKNSVRVCVWLGLVLLTWSLLFSHGVQRSPKTTKALHYVSRTLASLLIGSVLWLVKTLLVKILASNFHLNTFFDRIQESIFHQYVLQTLSGPPLMELAEKVGHVKSTSHLSLRSTGKGKGKGKGAEELGMIDVGKLQKMKHEKVSAWTMKGLINVISSSGLSTISNTIECFDEEGSEQMDKEITSEWEAKAAAYRIFKNVAKPGYKYIDEEDLLRFLSKEEVTYVLPLFEGAVEMGKIKKSALRNWVMIVEEMNILTTTFLRYDNEKIFYPNAVLLTKPISNFYRSPDMSDSIKFSVDVSTAIESIGALKSKIKAYIDNKPNYWHPNHSIIVENIVDINKMNMTLNVRHTMNFQNIVEKNNRRSDLVLELKKIFEELSIRYHLLPQEVHFSYTGFDPLPVSIGQSI